jgi:hypothetical protein
LELLVSERGPLNHVNNLARKALIGAIVLVGSGPGTRRGEKCLSKARH